MNFTELADILRASKKYVGQIVHKSMKTMENLYKLEFKLLFHIRYSATFSLPKL